MQLSSRELSLHFEPQTGSLNLKSGIFPNAALKSCFELHYSINNRKVNPFTKPLTIQQVDKPEGIITRFGPVNTIKVKILDDPNKIQITLWLGIASEHSLACLRFTITNQGDHPITLHRITFLNIQPSGLNLGTSNNSEPAFYSHGWQSWSHTGTYGSGERQAKSILGPCQNPMVVNPGTPQPRRKNHFTGDFFGVLGDRATRIGLLAGCLSQKTHYSSLAAWLKPTPRLKMWANGDDALLPAKKCLLSDWTALSFIDLDTPEPLGRYFSAVAHEHDIHSHDPAPAGWCSWYHFYQGITEQNIKENLASLLTHKKALPLTLFQIDDGYETFPGDWFEFTPDFPNGVKPIAQKAKNNGLAPGLWLAPFIVHPKSNLLRDHPDWILRNKRGQPVNAGFVWNTFTYALDLTKPAALAYTCKVIRTAVHEWGFKYLKLDFLYAAALDGVYQDQTRTRAQVLREGLQALREAAGPGVTMLACGCPLGSGLGLFDAMRIGADVSGHWKPHFPPVSLLLQHEPHMPAARNALQNILTRAQLHHHWWINDPDCLLVREDTHLTLDEVQTLATAIGLTGGTILLSDDLPALSEERRQIAQVLLPAIDQRAWVMDWFDSKTPAKLRLDLNGPIGPWHLLARFNWHNQPVSLGFAPQEFKLPETSTWWLREFWSGTTGKMGPGMPFFFHDVPPHGVRVIAVRPVDVDQPAYLGSNVHLSQGLEIDQWQTTPRVLNLRFNLTRRASGSVLLYLPWKPSNAFFNDNQIQPYPNQVSGIYSFNLVDLDGGELHIQA